MLHNESPWSFIEDIFSGLIENNTRIEFLNIANRFLIAHFKIV